MLFDDFKKPESRLLIYHELIMCLLKGGCSHKNIRIIITILHDSYNDDYTDEEIESEVLAGHEILLETGGYKNTRNIQQEVENLIEFRGNGIISLSDFYLDLKLDRKEEKISCRMAINRLVSRKVLEKVDSGRTGIYRKINGDLQETQFITGNRGHFPIKLPLDLNSLCYLHPKSIVVVAGSKGAGKGHPNGTKILSEFGWKNIEDLVVGDNVFSQDGTLTTITGVFPRGSQQCFKFNFNDRTSITTDFEHLWKVLPPYNRMHKVTGRGKKSLKYKQYEIIESYKLLSKVGGFGKISSWLSFRIPKNEALQYRELPIPIDPYLMGLMIGDGALSRTTTTITTGDLEIIDYCKKTWEVGSIYKDKRNNCWTVPLLKMKRKLQEIGLAGHRSWNKFIPRNYLFNSIDIRLNLLRGLMDTDGEISKRGNSIVFTTTSEQLCEDVTFLVRSMGGKVTITSCYKTFLSNGMRKQGRLAYRLHIAIENYCPFLLKRKKEKYKTKNNYKRMVSIENAGIQETTCISVDHPSGLYIAQDFIVTHNTALLLKLASDNQNSIPVDYFNSDMGDEEYTDRMVKMGFTCPEDIKFKTYNRSRDFQDLITPEKKIFIIDFLEIHENFFEIGKPIKAIWDKLKDGVAVIAIQMRTGAIIARGGDFTKEKSRLYLSLDYNNARACTRVTIVDAKAPKFKDGVKDWYRDVKIINGSRFSPMDNWRRNDGSDLS